MACKISREPYIFSYLDSVGFLRCFFGKILQYMSPVVTGDNNGKSFEKKKKKKHLSGTSQSKALIYLIFCIVLVTR